jgi:hypothetical protein
MAAITLRATSLFEMAMANVMPSIDRAPPVRAPRATAQPEPLARSLSSSRALDLSRTLAYDAALEIPGAYKLTGNFHVNLEIVLRALGALNEVTFEVEPADGQPYHPDCRRAVFHANDGVSPDRFNDIIRSIRARLAFD